MILAYGKFLNKIIVLFPLPEGFKSVGRKV
jgi:hypothetical protein